MASWIAAQVFGANFPIVFTEEVILTVIPESKAFSFVAGVLLLGMIIYKRIGSP
jgi:hypothetical protein